jgi:hypothetical protein
LFKLGAVSVAAVQFNLNSSAYLAAVEAIAAAGGERAPGGLGGGLAVLDKAAAAAASARALAALGKMADLLQAQAAGGAADGNDTSSNVSSKGDMLADLAAFVTLDRAQRLQGFDAAALGLTDAQAADVAVAFACADANDDGVLSADEFRRLCGRLAPELDDAGVAAALELIDTNRDGSVDFSEFVRFAMKRLPLEGAAGSSSA